MVSREILLFLKFSQIAWALSTFLSCALQPAVKGLRTNSSRFGMASKPLVLNHEAGQEEKYDAASERADVVN